MFGLYAAGPRALLAFRVSVTAGARGGRQRRHGVCGVSVPQSLAPVLRLTAALVLQQLHEEADVLHGEAQDLVLAQLLVGRVGRDEFAELGESAVHILLPPALAAVSEDAPSHFLRRT